MNRCFMEDIAKMTSAMDGCLAKYICCFKFQVIKVARFRSHRILLSIGTIAINWR